MERQPLGSHLSGSVPISIAVHVVLVLLVVIVPLTVDPSTIAIASGIEDYVRTVPLPPPPPDAAPRAPRVAATRPVDVSVAPASAPASITAEASTSPAPPDVGIPSGIGNGTADLGAIGSNIGQPVAIRLPDLPRQAGPVRVADLPVPPRKIVDVRPVYSELARQTRTQGTVVLEAVLDSTGSVTQLRVIRSVPLLDQAALDAVRRWKYTPSLYGGRPVSVLMTITITFTLQP